MAEGLDDAALYVLADGPRATKLETSPGEAIDLHVQIRGNPSKPGPLVPRRFLTVLSADGRKPFTHRQRAARTGPGNRERRGAPRPA